LNKWMTAEMCYKKRVYSLQSPFKFEMFWSYSSNLLSRSEYIISLVYSGRHTPFLGVTASWSILSFSTIKNY
jgi:hypothetical protein